MSSRGSCFFFKQKTAYELRISDWSSDVCSSDLGPFGNPQVLGDGCRNGELSVDGAEEIAGECYVSRGYLGEPFWREHPTDEFHGLVFRKERPTAYHRGYCEFAVRSAEHTSELQSLMRHSYAVFWLQKKKT